MYNCEMRYCFWKHAAEMLVILLISSSDAWNVLVLKVILCFLWFLIAELQGFSAVYAAKPVFSFSGGVRLALSESRI